MITIAIVITIAIAVAVAIAISVAVAVAVAIIIMLACYIRNITHIISTVNCRVLIMCEEFVNSMKANALDGLDFLRQGHYNNYKYKILK